MILKWESITVMESTRLLNRELTLENLKTAYTKAKAYSDGAKTIFMRASTKMVLEMVWGNFIVDQYCMKDFGYKANPKTNRNSVSPVKLTNHKESVKR